MPNFTNFTKNWAPADWLPRDPLFPGDLFNHSQLQFGAGLLYALGSLVTLVAAVIINKRFVVEGVKVGVGKIRNERLRSVLSNILVGGARSYPKFVFALLAYFVAFSDIGLATVLGSIGFSLHVIVGLGLFDFKRHFGSQKEVLLNCLLMLTVSGFGWSILTDGKAFSSMVPRLIPAFGFIVLYLVIFLLPLCYKYKVGEEEGDMPMHEEEKGNMLNGEQTDSPDNSSSSLFKSPTGILRSRGSSLLCLISWCEYVATLATALLPSLSMFCCDPLTRPNTRLWPLAVTGGALWVTCLLYLNVWWVTVVGNTLRMPSEVMGLVFVGPIMASSNLPLLARPTFVLQEITEILLNDILHGACLPFIFYFVAHGSYHIQAWYSTDLFFILLQMTILLTHLIFLCTNSSCSSSCCSIFQGLALIGFYILFFLPLVLANIFGRGCFGATCLGLD